MTNLYCSVDSCASNQDGCCCLSHIQVGGRRAHSCADTCCDSYTERGPKFTNSVGRDQPAVATEIACEACNCDYNKNEACCAREINVKDCMCGTECATFKEK